MLLYCLLDYTLSVDKKEDRIRTVERSNRLHKSHMSELDMLQLKGIDL